MVGLSLVKSLYRLPTLTPPSTWSVTIPGLRKVLRAAPSADAAYRFTVKLREHRATLDAGIENVIAALRKAHPEMGHTVAIDGSDLPAYGNGQKYVSRGGALRKRFSDPDASWGHLSSISTRRGGGFCGHKVHAAVCTQTGLRWDGRSRPPRTPRSPKCPAGGPDAHLAVTPGVLVLDRGYDTESLYETTEGYSIWPVIPGAADSRRQGRQAWPYLLRTWRVAVRRVDKVLKLVMSRPR